MICQKNVFYYIDLYNHKIRLLFLLLIRERFLFKGISEIMYFKLKVDIIFYQLFFSIISIKVLAIIDN